MKRLIAFLLGLLLLSACGKDQYMVNPRGSKTGLVPCTDSSFLAISQTWNCKTN